MLHIYRVFNVLSWERKGVLPRQYKDFHLRTQHGLYYHKLNQVGVIVSETKERTVQLIRFRMPQDESFTFSPPVKT